MDASPLENLVGSYPEVAAILLLILGFFLAKLAHRQSGRLMAALDRIASRYTTSSATLVSPELTLLAQSAIYWFIVLFSGLFAFRILGAGGLTDWLDTTLAFVPRLIVGLAIIGGGHFLGGLARYLLSQLSENLEPDATGLRILHAAIVVIATVLGLQHMLLDISFITQLLLVSLVILGGGLSLAFALGSKSYVENIVARSELDRFNIGERIRIDDAEGEIVEILSTTVRIDTSEGIVSIPCARFLVTTVVQLRGDDDGH